MTTSAIFLKRDTSGCLATPTPWMIWTKQLSTWLIMLYKNWTLSTANSSKVINFRTCKPKNKLESTSRSFRDRRCSQWFKCHCRPHDTNWINTSESSASKYLATILWSTATWNRGWSKWIPTRVWKSHRHCYSSWFQGCWTTRSNWHWTRFTRL